MFKVKYVDSIMMLVRLDLNLIVSLFQHKCEVSETVSTTTLNWTHHRSGLHCGLLNPSKSGSMDFWGFWGWYGLNWTQKPGQLLVIVTLLDNIWRSKGQFCIFGVQMACTLYLQRGLWFKIWGFAWWKSVSSRFAVTPCVISTIAKLRYRFWKEPNRTTRIPTVAKWELWFRENHGDLTGSSLRFD